MPKLLDVIAENGVPFRVVLIARGEVGPNPHRADGKGRHATVEFYDARYPHTEHGQFTGGYYALSTLLDPTRAPMREAYGLDLAGGVDSWKLDGATMRFVQGWLRSYATRLPEDYPADDDTSRLASGLAARHAAVFAALMGDGDDPVIGA